MMGVFAPGTRATAHVLHSWRMLNTPERRVEHVFMEDLPVVCGLPLI